MKSADAIVFDLRPPVSLGVLLGALMLLGVMSVWSSGLAAYPRIAAAAGCVVALSCTHTMGRVLRLRWRRVGWNADGVWTLLDEKQRASTATLAGWSALAGALFLRLRTTAGERVTVFALPDNLDRDTRRRLRVRLEQEAPSRPPTSR